MGGEFKPQNEWPRVRQVQPGVYRVKGRVVPIGAWLVFRPFCRLVVLLGLLWLVGAVFVGPVFDATQSLGHTHPAAVVVGSMMEFRFFLRELLTVKYPQVGQAIYYTGLNRTDFHLLGLTVVLFWLRSIISFGVCRLVVVLLFPLISRRFKVTIYRDMVVVHKLFRSVKLRRTPENGGINFTAAGPRHQKGLIGKLLRAGKLRPNGEADFCVVQAIAQGRPITITTPRKALDAERIVQSLMMAMNASSPTSSVPAGVFPGMI